MIDRVGRRPLFLVGTAGMLVSFSVWTACSGIYDVDGDLTAGKVVVAFIFIYGVFYHISWSGPLVAYTVEIMPYKLRAKGLMSMNYFVQAALVFNQYVNPIGLGAMKPRWHFYTIYCVSLDLVSAFMA
jgi:MFS family permease